MENNCLICNNITTKQILDNNIRFNTDVCLDCYDKYKKYNKKCLQCNQEFFITSFIDYSLIKWGYLDEIIDTKNGISKYCKFCSWENHITNNPISIGERL
jgi:hypothetical protein